MANLEVIYDSGRGVPASIYLSYLVRMDPQPGEEVLPGLSFPIESRLAPGNLRKPLRVFDPLWLAQPIFVIGDEKKSLDWLERNYGRLMRADAWGAVVQARGPQSFQAFKAVAPGLQYAPAGDWLSDQLWQAGLDVFPCFIGLNGLAIQEMTDAEFGPANPTREQQP